MSRPSSEMGPLDDLASRYIACEDARILQLAWAPFGGAARVLPACAGLVVASGRHALGEVALLAGGVPAVRVDRLVLSADALRGGPAAADVEASVAWRGLACEVAEVREVDDRCRVLVLREPPVIQAALEPVCVRLENRGRSVVVVCAYFLGRASVRALAEVGS